MGERASNFYNIIKKLKTKKQKSPRYFGNLVRNQILIANNLIAVFPQLADSFANITRRKVNITRIANITHKAISVCFVSIHACKKFNKASEFLFGCRMIYFKYESRRNSACEHYATGVVGNGTH